MTRRHPIVLYHFCLAFGLSVAGCGGGGDAVEGVKVTGSVTKGGAGQAGVMVGFIRTDQAQGGNSRAAATDAQGQFEALLLPGKYAVTLSKQVDASGNAPPPNADVGMMLEDGQLRESMPPQYTDPTLTPLSADVPEKGGELQPFTIEG